MFYRFLSIPWALDLPGLEYTRVVNMPRLDMVLHKFCFKGSHYFECFEFWICNKGFECIRSLNMLYLRVMNKVLYPIYFTEFWINHCFKICHATEYIRVLNMPGFINKTLHHIDARQGTDYSSGFAYIRVLNMPGLHKAILRMLHHRC